MPRVAEELTALDVKRLIHPGGKRNVLFSVGGVPGLHLQVTPKDGRSWVLRTTVGSLRRDITVPTLETRSKDTGISCTDDPYSTA